MYLTYYNLWIAKIYSKLIINLANNLFEEIHRIKVKYRHDDKKYDTCRQN